MYVYMSYDPNPEILNCTNNNNDIDIDTEYDYISSIACHL